jgi:hypothetical protein
MSSFSGYSNSINNIFGLSDEKIKEYYFLAEKDDKRVELQYFIHRPKTMEELNNPNFLMDSCVQTVNEYLIKLAKRK